MKKSISLISFCLGLLLFTSCVSPRAAYLARSERASFSSGFSSISPEKMVKASARAQATNSSNLLNSVTTSLSGVVIGAYFTDIELADKLELQPEIDLLLVKNLTEIQVPVLVKYNVADKFSALAGPNIGYLLDTPANLKSLNLGVDIGAAYEITDNFNVNARYGLGLTDLSEIAGTEIKLSGFQIGLGYEF